MSILTWNAGTFAASLADKVERGMNLAVAILADDIRTSVAIEGRGIPSAPGEPPHKQTGTLQLSIDSRVDPNRDAVRGYVGVFGDVPYAMRLEFGFAGLDSLGRNYNQAPRPFLRPALLRNFELIVATMCEAVGS